jgi:hypothetical protein
MKKYLFLLALLQSPVFIYAQGTVEFRNDSLSLVRLGTTGQPVVAANGIRASLHYAPDGVTNPGLFVSLGSSTWVGTVPPIPGIFIGGTRTTPPSCEPGGFAMFQVRYWEAAYGATYEQALLAPPMNGRSALTGTSPIVRVRTGGEVSPPLPPGRLAGYLSPVTLQGSLAERGLSVGDVVVGEGPVGTPWPISS